MAGGQGAKELGAEGEQIGAPGEAEDGGQPLRHAGGDFGSLQEIDDDAEEAEDAAGGVFGLLGIIINLLQAPEISTRVPQWLTSILRLPWRPDLFSFGPKLLGPLATSHLFGVIMFVLLAASLFYFARKKLD